MGYSLSWSYRDVPGVNDNRPYYAAFDTRHNMNLLANRNFRFAGRGFPFNRWVRFFRYNRQPEYGPPLCQRPRFTRPYS